MEKTQCPQCKKGWLKIIVKTIPDGWRTTLICRLCEWTADTERGVA